MSNVDLELEKWSAHLLTYHLPRWEELPDIDLYMDQVVTLIDKYIGLLLNTPANKVITPAMINNYVKLGLMPKPEKKRYNRTHLAYLLAITILKQVLTIVEVKNGILLQSKISGTKDAYNLFCEEQERALQLIAHTAQLQSGTLAFGDNLNRDNLAVKMATLAFASKVLTEKILELRQDHLQQAALPTTAENAER